MRGSAHLPSGSRDAWRFKTKEDASQFLEAHDIPSTRVAFPSEAEGGEPHPNALAAVENDAGKGDSRWKIVSLNENEFRCSICGYV